MVDIANFKLTNNRLNKHRCIKVHKQFEEYSSLENKPIDNDNISEKTVWKEKCH